MQKIISGTLAVVVLAVLLRAIYLGPPKTECLQRLDGDCIKLRIVPEKSGEDRTQPNKSSP